LEFVAVVWRPTASALGLYFLLPIVASAIGVPLLAGRIAALLAEVGLGALIYMVLMFSLWFLAGRPQGAEIHTLRIISAVAGRVFSRFSRADSGGSP
jgi:hypothetical protein